MFGTAAGLTPLQISNLDFFETSDLYDDHERMVLRFTSAALDGEIPDELFEQARAHYGTKELMEFIIAIAYWTFWAVILNCTRPEVDFA
jgi:alkylhydroperoxidase family enzyme